MKLSIITCTKNSEKYLEYLIKSVLSQKYSSLEHIFIDGDSNDKTLDILRRYKEKANYPVKIFRRKPKGISDAMNCGFKKSGGEIVVFIQSDDALYGKNTLKEITRTLKASSKKILIGKCLYINERNKIIAERPKKLLLPFFKIFPYFFIKRTNFISHPSVYIKREVLEKEKVIYSPKLKFAMDYDLWLRILKNNKPLFYNKKISCFRYYSKGISSNPKNKKEFWEEEHQLRKNLI